VGDLVVGPPRVVQATQVATEIYWRAPDVSRQVVVGVRDTSLLPTDNQFYRDRYGIVVNNFPDVVRLGEGRDVADVPHPLSPAGLAAYDFAARDTLGIRLGQGRPVRVVEVQVRPRDPSRPRLVGSLFVDLETARLVRLAFTFTRAAYLDPRNEDVSVVLENALVEGRFWLPRRQEIEVRRAGTFLDFPARGIIRGRWDVGEYEVNAGLADTAFAGAPLQFAPPEAQRRYPFPGRVVDALPPDVQLATQEDVARVRAQAQALVQAGALVRARGASVAARSASDFVRVTRAEGLALGAGVALRPAPAARAGLVGRYGLDDRQAKGRLSLAWARPAAPGCGSRPRATTPRRATRRRARARATRSPRRSSAATGPTRSTSASCTWPSTRRRSPPRGSAGCCAAPACRPRCRRRGTARCRCARAPSPAATSPPSPPTASASCASRSPPTARSPRARSAAPWR
jgi:hypothetical protein